MLFKKLRALFFVVFIAVCMTQCISSNNVSKEYQEQKTKAQSKSTTIVFLIDGLSHSVFEQQLKAHKLPHIATFFDATSPNSVQKIHSVFPTLTFPNITALLTLSPVDQNPIYGNRIVEKTEESGEFTNFEKPAFNNTLNKLIEPQTIFSDLKQTHLDSVSFSYSFFSGSTANIKLNLKAGIQYANMDYAAVDTEILERAQNLFEQVPAKEWPHLVFIHLIGVDATSHQYGPQSDLTKNYLRKIDNLLKPLFLAIQRKESEHLTSSLLLTDHGLISIKKTISFEKLVTSLFDTKKTPPLVLNETRIASLFFSKDWSDQEISQQMNKLKQNTAIKATAIKSKQQNLVTIILKNQSFEFTYIENQNCSPYNFALHFNGQIACPQWLDKNIQISNLMYFFESFASYFHGVSNTQIIRPDVVVLAEDNWGFNNLYAGAHGGLSEQEVVTPFMLRHAKLNAQMRDPLPIYQALQFLKTNQETRTAR